MVNKRTPEVLRENSKYVEVRFDCDCLPWRERMGTPGWKAEKRAVKYLFVIGGEES